MSSRGRDRRCARDSGGGMALSAPIRERRAAAAKSLWLVAACRHERAGEMLAGLAALWRRFLKKKSPNRACYAATAIMKRGNLSRGGSER